eukprot:2549213-Rhodomonas_salina.5
MPGSDIARQGLVVGFRPLIELEEEVQGLRNTPPRAMLLPGQRVAMALQENAAGISLRVPYALPGTHIQVRSDFDPGPEIFGPRAKCFGGGSYGGLRDREDHRDADANDHQV